jgi:hypothetical protein
MHGVNNIKFINARQAKEIHQYKNVTVKLHKMNAAIWYNKMCKQLQLTPKLADSVGWRLKQCNILFAAARHWLVSAIMFLGSCLLNQKI